jgi:HdeA/HdeB family
MKRTIMWAAAALAITCFDVRAQTDLSAYADANGYLDVQKLTCAQLAGTWQEDADKLMVWYSGWYNGLAKKHFFHISRGVRLEHEVIVHCKAHPNIRVIDAIAVVLKDERAARGIEMR